MSNFWDNFNKLKAQKQAEAEQAEQEFKAEQKRKAEQDALWKQVGATLSSALGGTFAGYTTNCDYCDKVVETNKKPNVCTICNKGYDVCNNCDQKVCHRCPKKKIETPVIDF